VSAVIISGCAPWDGRYEFPDFALTNRELHRVKTLCGIRAGELIDALDANDTGAYVAFAAVVMERNGKAVEVDDLWDSAVGSIRIELGGEADADPPTMSGSGDVPGSVPVGSGGAT